MRSLLALTGMFGLGAPRAYKWYRAILCWLRISTPILGCRRGAEGVSCTRYLVITTDAFCCLNFSSVSSLITLNEENGTHRFLDGTPG